MKKSSKALLFSALIFPGAGHLVLKRYARGIALLVPSIVALIVICNDAMQKASSIADKILSGEVSPD
ncbi:MAG TPA: DUF6677 family protein, partial [Rhodocyclaceae bacterium]|nr:DUF6677 family protein [Rhodocyclaceae bacterium]